MKQKFSLLAAFVCICGGGEVQAQLFINVYPSQDNVNQTLWIFSGTGTARASSAVRTGSNTFDSGDTFEFVENSGNIYDANKPSDVNFSLSPLFSSANTADINSVLSRIPGGGKTDITFAASATNTPTITIGSASRTISHLFLDEDSGAADDFGIRVSGSNLSYSSGQSSAWVGAGLINKSIGDFFARTFRSDTPSARFAANSQGSMRLTFNSAAIPEPEEYAFVFALFAIGFVFFRRHWQKKHRQTAAS